MARERWAARQHDDGGDGGDGKGERRTGEGEAREARSNEVPVTQRSYWEG
jgi:hypothetical protein